MTIRKISNTTVPRDFRLKPENIRASVLELQAVMASVAQQWNETAYPLFDKLQDSAFSDGIDGRSLFVDFKATPESYGGLFWTASKDRQATIQEAISKVHQLYSRLYHEVQLVKVQPASVAATAYDDTLLKKWIKQIAAETGTAAFVSRAQGTEFTEELFTNSPTQTESNNLRDQTGNLRSIIGEGVTRTSTAIGFPATTVYLSGATTIREGLIALDTGLKEVETEWEESNGNIYRVNGNVGVGTATPSRPLNVVSAENILIRAENTAIGGDCLSNYRTTHGTDKNIVVGLRGADGAFVVSKGTELGQDDFFAVSSTGDAHVTTGSLGVGTTAPATKLHVAGTVGATGTSAAALAYTFVGNTTTGIYSPSANVLRFATSANHAATLNALGNLGVGETTPTEKLHVAGNIKAESGSKSLMLDVDGSNSSNAGLWSSGSHLVLGSKTTNDLNIFLNDAETLQITRGTSPVNRVSYTSHGGSGVHHFAGNVGVGTNNPSTTLDVAGDVNLSGDLSFDGSSTVASSIINENNFASASATALASSASIKAYVDALKLDWKAGTGGPQSTADNEILLVLGGDGVTTTGSSDTISIATDVAQAHVTSVGTLTSLNVAGNVGVRTTSPGKTLEVKASVAADGINLISFDNATPVVQLEAGTQGGYIQIQNNSNAQNVRLDATGPSWFKGGSLGVGNEAPAKTLDVTGDFKVSGTTTFNNVEWAWPSSNGSDGQLLSTDGEGVIELIDPPSGVTTFAGCTDVNLASVAMDQIVKFDAGGDLVNGKIGSGSISGSAVTETAIADNAVTSAKIAVNAVGSSEVAENAIGESELDPTAIPIFKGHAVSIYFASGDEISIGDVVQLTQTGGNGPEGRRHDSGSDPTAGAFGGMGIALEAGSGGAAIKVIIKGEASARIDQIPGVALSKGIKLIPSAANDGSLKKEGSPETGELVGWLLEDVTSGSSIVLKKIWVQPS